MAIKALKEHRLTVQLSGAESQAQTGQLKATSMPGDRTETTSTKSTKGDGSKAGTGQVRGTVE